MFNAHLPEWDTIFFYNFVIIYITKDFSFEMRKVKHICYMPFNMRTKISIQTQYETWKLRRFDNIMLFVWPNDFNDTSEADILCVGTIFSKNPLIKFYTPSISLIFAFLSIFCSSNKVITTGKKMDKIKSTPTQTTTTAALTVIL